jgi:ATP-dependent protease ClpP protease subunit
LAIGAEEIEISDGGMFMIHNAWNIAIGNADDMLEMAALLEKVDANIAADYQRKTGASAEQIAEWMKAETWFSAAEALEHGFVDRIYKPADDGDAADDCKPKKAKAQAAANLTDPAARARLLRLAALGTERVSRKP